MSWSMNKPAPTDPSAALAALADDYSIKSKAALFRAHFDSIEKALQSGAPRSRVLAILNEHGIIFTPAAFNEYLYRERNKRRKVTGTDANQMPSSQAIQSIVSVPVSSKETAIEHPRSDPAILDAIIKSTPDLESLAKIHKDQQKKGSQ